MSSTKPNTTSSRTSTSDSRRRSPRSTTSPAPNIIKTNNSNKAMSSSAIGTKAPSSSVSSSKSPSSSSASKRLLQELSQLRASAHEETTSASNTSTKDELSPIERLGPVSDEELFHWEAVVNGKGLGAGYDGGRWLLDIRVPDGSGGGGNGASGSGGGGSYPLAPPAVRFVTRICAANVGFETGEICLDLLKTAWTPAYTLKMTVEAIWQMLAAPSIDSPLNVDLAALVRGGDRVGSEALVRWGCVEWRWDGR